MADDWYWFFVGFFSFLRWLSRKIRSSSPQCTAEDEFLFPLSLYLSISVSFSLLHTLLWCFAYFSFHFRLRFTSIAEAIRLLLFSSSLSLSPSLPLFSFWNGLATTRNVYIERPPRSSFLFCFCYQPKPTCSAERNMNTQ